MFKFWFFAHCEFQFQPLLFLQFAYLPQIKSTFLFNASIISGKRRRMRPESFQLKTFYQKLFELNFSRIKMFVFFVGQMVCFLHRDAHWFFTKLSFKTYFVADEITPKKNTYVYLGRLFQLQHVNIKVSSFLQFQLCQQGGKGAQLRGGGVALATDFCLKVFLLGYLERFSSVKVRWKFLYIIECRTWIACNHCDQIGRFIALCATIQSLWQQLISPNLLHSWAIFVNLSKSFLFLVKSYLGNFYRHLAIFFWTHCWHQTVKNLD